MSAVNPFNLPAASFKDSLQASTVVDFKADEAKFSIGSGKSSAVFHNRITPFLALVDSLDEFDPSAHAASNDGGTTASTIQINYGKADDDGNRSPETVEFVNDRTNRRVILSYDAAREIIKPDLLDSYQDRINEDDPVDALRSSFAHVQTDGDEDNAPVNQYEFRLSFAPNTRVMKVPADQWDTFAGTLRRMADYIRTNSDKYRPTEDDTDAEVSD